MLPRLPHIAMFPPPASAPPCPAATSTPVATPTPVLTPTPVVPIPSGPPALDKRFASKWRYVLKFDLPSRIATMKNALGDTVSIIPSYTPPSFNLATRAGMQGAWATTANTVTISSTLDSNKWRDEDGNDHTVTEINPECAGGGGPGIVPGCNTWVFELDYASGSTVSEDPGPPFDAIADWATGRPKAGVGTWEEEAPANIVGVSRTRINWGLLAYSTTGTNTCTGYDTTTSNLLVTAINPSGSDVSGILASMRLSWDGGLKVGGGTPTRSALEKAEQQLIDTFAIDPLYACLRNYGVILVTDGESNTCNYTDNVNPAIANREWGPNCPTDWDKYPPQITDQIWNLNLTTPCVGKTPRDTPINPRSWVIGFGSEVGKCELNYTAYKGRTDANSPKADAGFSTNEDPRLRTCTAYSDPPANTICTAWIDAPYDDSKDYAYFADDTKSLVKAFNKITSAAATGDYATGAPLTGGAAGYGNIVFLSSTYFPTWEGHLYKLDTNLIDKDTGVRLPGYRVWDAATILAARDASTRRIYTWNPSTRNLIEVKASALATLQTIEPTLTPAVIDFIRGNDGSGVARAQRLGPLINTVPSIVAGPLRYTQSTISGDHATFEADYANRRAMIWIGSNDGMLHAFDFQTGEEVLAILPPQLLDSQVELYDTFLAAGKVGTGQPDDFSNTYGVAGSLRFGDVYFPSGFRTVGLLTLADGGDLVAAIDITHPYPGQTSPVIAPDPNYGVFPRAGDLVDAPVQVIWQKTSADLPGLGPTWSLPGLAPRSTSTWSILFGAGYDTASVYTSQKVPRVFQLDPVDGTQIGVSAYKDLALDGSNVPWVGNQAFADSVLFRHLASGYASDNIATRGVQADLNGRVWFVNPTNINAAPLMGIDASAVAGQSQPIYYPPAAGGFGMPPTSGCNVYAFGSGTFYEESTRVNGPGTGTAGNFIPSLYFAATEKSNPNTDVPTISDVLRIPINTILRPESTTETLSPLSQMTGAPLLLIDPKGFQPSVGIFVIYDPTVGCNGASYAVTVRWKTSGCDAPLTVKEGTTNTTTDAGGAVVKTVFAGYGAASGLTSVGDQVFSGIAGLGAGGQADLAGIKESSAFGSGAAFRPVWWKELK